MAYMDRMSPVGVCRDAGAYTVLWNNSKGIAYLQVLKGFNRYLKANVD